MERYKTGYADVLILSLVIILGLVSFSLCFAAEFKRSKKEDLRFNGRLCYLPGSHGFEMGIAALVLLFIGQIIGNLFICSKFWPRNHERSCKAKKFKIVIISFMLSWISFGGSVILIGTAASMSQSQLFGEGWLDGECYIVKDGVYIGSSILILITVCSTTFSAIFTIRKKQIEHQAKKVHAKGDSPYQNDIPSN